MTLQEKITVAPEKPTTELAPFARWPVFGLAGLLAAVLLGTATRYGYFGDELYFRLAGQNLDWSFPDQPPLVPALAGLMDLLFPGSLFALRVPAILITTAGVVVCALIARELGGSRRAQVFAAAAFLASPFMVLFGRYLLTSTVDVTLAGVVTLLIVRWLRTRDDRLLLATGLVVAVALQAKLMIVIVVAALLVGLIAFGPRAMLARRPLWIGAGIAVLTAVPMLIWQSSHGWPQLHMGDVLELAAEDKMFSGGPVGFFLDAALFCGIVGTLLLGYGLVRAFRTPDLRFFAVAFVLLCLLFASLNWSGYYVAGLFPVLWAIGATGLDRVRGRWLPWVAWPVYVLSIAGQYPQLPLQPIEEISVAERNGRFDVLATAGWPELVADVATTYHSLPLEQQGRVAIITRTYEPASAIDRYGADYDLPKAYSPMVGLWYFGTPPATADMVLFVGSPPERLLESFSSAEEIARIDNGLGVENSFQDLPVWLLEGRDTSWDNLWPALRTP